jgi:uncharacterized protein YndB with AHSA1/START domain
MPTLETEIAIDVPAQLVWSVLDNIERYREWNEIISDPKGRIIAGERA